MRVGGVEVVSEAMTTLRDIWEDTSFQLEKLQANPACVSQERCGLASRKEPPYKLTFDPHHVIPAPANSIPNGIGQILNKLHIRAVLMC